jgi:RNA polymerase sigma-70 factor (ECF subfamily)
MTQDLAAASVLSDDELVARVRRGETALYEHIMRRYNARLFRAARAILRNDAEAEDAVQQAYISAYEHLGQFQGEARFSTWLTRIVVHAALGRRRSIGRRAEVELPSETEEMMSGRNASAESPERALARRQLGGVIEAAIDALPDLYRVVFVLREVQQMSTAETAECLEVSEEVVKVRLHRGKLLLRDAMAAGVAELVPDSFAFLGSRCDRIVAGVMARLTALPLPKPDGG